MMFIVMHHIIITTVAPQFSSAVYNGFDTVFHTAVVIFVIISGYYGINFKVNKLVKLWAQVAYYSVLAGLIAFFVLHSIGIKSLAGCFFPIYTRPYWFVSAYVELFLFSPILNIVAQKASRRQQLAGILVLMFSTWAFPTDLLSGTGLPVFSMLYLVGRYMAQYKADSYKNNKHVALYLLILIAVITVLGIICPPPIKAILYLPWVVLSLLQHRDITVVTPDIPAFPQHGIPHQGHQLHGWFCVCHLPYPRKPPGITLYLRDACAMAYDHRTAFGPGYGDSSFRPGTLLRRF